MLQNGKLVSEKAIFFDRDGVLNKPKVIQGKPFAPTRYRDFIIYADAYKVIKNFKKHLYKIIVVTNQSGIGRGIYTERAFLKLHAKIKKFLIKKNIFIDEVKYCPHHAISGIGNYKKKCACRKPNNKMILDIFNSWSIDIKKSIMIGDKKTDLIAAKKSNIKFFYQNKKSFNEINRIFKKI